MIFQKSVDAPGRPRVAVFQSLSYAAGVVPLCLDARGAAPGVFNFAEDPGQGKRSP